MHVVQGFEAGWAVDTVGEWLSPFEQSAALIERSLGRPDCR